MTMTNLLTTAAELLFGFLIVFLFLIQDRLVVFEKKALRAIRLTLRRTRRRFRRFLRLQKAKRLQSFNRACCYQPVKAPSALPDRAA